MRYLELLKKLGLIRTSWKLWRKILSLRREHFILSSSDYCPKEPLLSKRDRSEIQYVGFIRATLFAGMMERWNGRISYNAEYLVVWNNCLTKMDPCVCAKIRGIAAGQILYVARGKCVAGDCFDVLKGRFWREINAFSPRVYRKWIKMMLIRGRRTVCWN